MRISNIANHRFVENYKNDPRVAGLAQIARICFLIMHRCVMDVQRYRNNSFLNLHTPPFHTLLKRWIIENICIWIHNNVFPADFFENMKFSLYPEV